MNPDIAIYGEAYYGEVSKKKRNKSTLECTTIDNMSGVLINNFGYANYNHAYIVNKILNKNIIKDYNKMSKMAQVIGHSPYYASKHNMNLSLDEEYMYKHMIEDSYKRVGCMSITTVHDGEEELFEQRFNTFNNMLYYRIGNDN